MEDEFTNPNILEVEEGSFQYVYPGLKHLSNANIESVANNFEDVTINTCVYQINRSGPIPFLQFVLRKYDKTHNENADLLSFPSFKYKSDDYIMDMCDLIENVISFTYRINPNNCEYKGFINIRNNFYVFYELDNNSIGPHDLYRRNDLWLVIIDEILNYGNCCNFKIVESVTNFFRENIDFSYLMDLNENYFETPVVAYVDCKIKNLNLTSIFGVSETTRDYLPESYFYFTNYESAVKMALSNDDSNRGGIVRFAIFPGYMAFLNKENLDPVKYDSIYINNNAESPLWALKKWEQQISLTCHYIDKTSVRENTDVSVTPKSQYIV